MNKDFTMPYKKMTTPLPPKTTYTIPQLKTYYTPPSYRIPVTSKPPSAKSHSIYDTIMNGCLFTFTLGTGWTKNKVGIETPIKPGDSEDVFQKYSKCLEESMHRKRDLDCHKILTKHYEAEKTRRYP